jgi:hypothetical protein
MSKTTFSGSVYAGTIKETANRNIGTMKMQQDVCFTIPASIATVIDPDGQTFSQYNGVNATAFAAFSVAATTSLNLPVGAQIVDIIIDVPTAIVGPTAANLTVGISAAGTEYVSSTNLMTGPVVRVRPTFTNAQLLAMMNVTTNTTLYAQLTGTVANFTAGVVYIQVIYTTNN